MPIVKPQGLKGLKSISQTRDEDRKAFFNKYGDLFARYDSNPTKKIRMMDAAYDNYAFTRAFGKDAFDSMNDGSQASYLERNRLLDKYEKEQNANYNNNVIENTWDKWVKPMSPYNDDGTLKRGGTHWNEEEWDKYNRMSASGKRSLMESKWLTPEEVLKSNEQMDKAKSEYHKVAGLSGQLYGANVYGYDAASDKLKSDNKQKNDNLLAKIYNKDLENRTRSLQGTVNAVANRDKRTPKQINDEVEKLFGDENSPMVQYGAGEYAAYKNTSDMKDFDINDKKVLLAKANVYMKHMTPQEAATAINNDLRDYVKDHQGWWRSRALDVKDFATSATTYAMDKVDGLYSIGLEVADATSEKPLVWVTNNGEVVDEKSVRRNANGIPIYLDKKGQGHYVHQARIPRTTLHLMGKNNDGSDDTSALNPMRRNLAEQFGTWNKDEQEKFQKLNASPYKYELGRDDESRFWWEATKMGVFPLVDIAGAMIPLGLGRLGSGISALSTAGKIGRAVDAAGKALSWTGKTLGTESTAGSMIQGGVGATAIANAYERGAFQETMTQNLADAEAAVNEKASRDVRDRYKNDKAYKNEVDQQIDAITKQGVNSYIRKARQNGQAGGIDVDKLTSQIKAEAKEQILTGDIANEINQLKQQPEYNKLIDRAITSAGNTALGVFWPEAVKYGLVNTFGYRKFLFRNPTGRLGRKVNPDIKKLSEVTTSGGKKRIVVTDKGPQTYGEKLKALGKTTLSNAWGGGWTNGTDDMMTDAAQQINNDSYREYINGYHNGEAIADTYGFLDGLYSYWNGLMESAYKPSTFDAFAIGAVGGTLSITPNFVNIAKLASKQGREEYRNRFQQDYARDENGMLKKDKDGNPIKINVSAKDNWRERLGYFITNGVLNNYYGALQERRGLQEHADYVNSLLDEYNDFDAIKQLIASERALDNSNGRYDKKTMRFLTGLKMARLFNTLARNENDPSSTSSVIVNLQDGIEKISNSENLTEEEIANNEELKGLADLYYEQNKDEQGKVDDNKRNTYAFEKIRKNIEDLNKSIDAYNKAEKMVAKAERDSGKTFDPIVKEALKNNITMDGHWRERREQMEQELGLNNHDAETPTGATLIRTIGGKKASERLMRVYDRQEKEVLAEIEKQAKDVAKKQEARDKAKKEVDESEEIDFKKTKALEVTESRLENSKLQREQLNEILERTKTKREAIKQGLEEIEKGKVGLLTADDILALDYRSMAYMLDDRNGGIFTPKQKNEINKAKSELLQRDMQAMEKLNDLASLSNRIATNEDAYSKVLSNPEAAAIAFTAKERYEAQDGYNLLNQKNAEIITDKLKNLIEENGLSADSEEVEKGVFDVLKMINTPVLQIIKDGNLLDGHGEAIDRAMEFSGYMDKVYAAITLMPKTEDWKQMIAKHVSNAIKNIDNTNDVIDAIRKASKDKSKSEDVRRGLEGIADAIGKADKLSDAINTREKEDEKKSDDAKEIDADKGDKRDDSDRQKEIHPEGEYKDDKDDSNIEGNSEVLSGNAMEEYDTEVLRTNKQAVRKIGKNKNDVRNQFNDWVGENGIDYQRIIDDELHRITEANPHTKVKFMTVLPSKDDKYGDKRVANHVFLVVDYDKNVEKIHNEDNGGVIESHGKQYLIIGVAGYGANNADKKTLYDNAKAAIAEERENYANSDDRFFVSDNITTEIIQGSQTQGHLVTKDANGKEEKVSLTQLLENKDSNPLGLAFDDLAFGIQRAGDFDFIGYAGKKADGNIRRIYTPRNEIENLGRSFVFIEASNGGLIPIALTPLKYKEMHDGKLKEKVANLLIDLASTDKDAAEKAVQELSNIFYFDKKNGVDVSRFGDEIIFWVKDNKARTIKVANDTDPSNVESAFNNLNPTVSITRENLSNADYMKLLDEAGALNVDVRQLETIGSKYAIYGIDKNGKMIKPKQPKISEYIPISRDTHEKQVILNGNFYIYDKDVDQFYLADRRIDDQKTLNDLRVNLEIFGEKKLGPVPQKYVKSNIDANVETYVLGEEENARVVQLDRNTYRVIRDVRDDEARSIIEEIREAKNAETRKNNAKKDVSYKDLRKAISEAGVNIPDQIELIKTSDETQLTAENAYDLYKAINDAMESNQPLETKAAILNQYYIGNETRKLLDDLVSAANEGKLPKDYVHGFIGYILSMADEQKKELKTRIEKRESGETVKELFGTTKNIGGKERAIKVKETMDKDNNIVIDVDYDGAEGAYRITTGELNDKGIALDDILTPGDYSSYYRYIIDKANIDADGLPPIVKVDIPAEDAMTITLANGKSITGRKAEKIYNALMPKVKIDNGDGTMTDGREPLKPKQRSWEDITKKRKEVIQEVSKLITLSDDGKYYYIKNPYNGKVERFLRTTSVISAERRDGEISNAYTPLPNEIANRLAEKFGLDREMAESLGYETTIEGMMQKSGLTENDIRRAIAELRTEKDDEGIGAWGTPSTTIGTAIDEVFRDFFAGQLKDSYPNVKGKALEGLKRQLNAFKAEIDKNGIKIIPNDVTVFGDMKAIDHEGKEHNIKVAGTLDLLGYNEQTGEYYIFDMKTMRGFDKIEYKAEKWAQQLSMYRDLLQQMYGITVSDSNLRIIPIQVTYDAPKGNERGTNPNGPTYSVDADGRLIETSKDGKQTVWADRDNTIQMRDTNTRQYEVVSDIGSVEDMTIDWDSLNSREQDLAEGRMDHHVVEMTSELMKMRELVKKTNDNYKSRAVENLANRTSPDAVSEINDLVKISKFGNEFKELVDNLLKKYEEKGYSIEMDYEKLSNAEKDKVRTTDRTFNPKVPIESETFSNMIMPQIKKNGKIIQEGERAKEFGYTLDEAIDKLKRYGFDNVKKLLQDYVDTTQTKIDRLTGEGIDKHRFEIEDLTEKLNKAREALGLEAKSDKKQPKDDHETWTFKEAIKNKSPYKRLIDGIFEEKMSEWGRFKNTKDKEEFLRSKGIEVDAMPKDKKGMETWLNTLKDCR